jgi:hypothetical protein
MAEPRDLLVGLLDYIKEQAKVIDPRGFVLGSSGTFLRRRGDVAGLQGVEFEMVSARQGRLFQITYISPSVWIAKFCNQAKTRSTFHRRR